MVCVKFYFLDTEWTLEIKNKIVGGLDGCFNIQEKKIEIKKTKNIMCILTHELFETSATHRGFRLTNWEGKHTMLMDHSQFTIVADDVGVAFQQILQNDEVQKLIYIV